MWSSNKELLPHCELVASPVIHKKTRVKGGNVRNDHSLLFLVQTQFPPPSRCSKLPVSFLFLSFNLNFLSFTSILTIQIILRPTSSLFPLSLSGGLGTLGRASPAGCVGRARSLIHPQRALWLNRLAQGHGSGVESRAGQEARSYTRVEPHHTDRKFFKKQVWDFRPREQGRKCENHPVGLHECLDEDMKVRRTCGLTLRNHWPHTPLLHLQLEEREGGSERYREGERERAEKRGGEMYFINVVP